MRRILISSIITALLVAAVMLVPFTGLRAASAPAAGPVLTVSTMSNSQGYNVTLRGFGFAPSSKVLVEYIFPDGYQSHSHPFTDAAGSFVETITLSSLHGTGILKIGAFDHASGVWSWSQINMKSPVVLDYGYMMGGPGTGKLTLSASSAVPGAVITLKGSGFSPSEAAYVSWTAPSGFQSFAMVSVGSDGTFSLPVAVHAADGTGITAFYAIDCSQLTTTPVVLLSVAAG